MHVIVVGFRTLMNALVNGEPLWPAVTLFGVSVVIAVAVAAVRYSRERRGAR